MMQNKNKKNKRNKKVLIVANCTWYLYNFRKELLNDLNDIGYNLILLSPFDDYYLKISKYFVKREKLFLIRGSENPFIELISLFNIFLAYLKYRPDLVHHFTIKPCIYGGTIARLLGVKNIINHITGLGPSFYSSRKKINYLNILLKPIYKYAFSNYANNTLNIFHNNSDKNTFINKGITSEKLSITIGGSGVDENHFKRKSHQKINKDINILFPARIIQEKGFIELIKACQELWEEKFKFKLNIAGEIDKQNKSHISSSIYKNLIKNPNIIFLGKKNNMAKIYKKMDMVVLPSWREGLSKSLLEAASMSLPIITTDVPGCNDIVKHEYSGLLVESKNEKELKIAIKKYLENPNLAMNYGKIARRTITKRFTIKKINSQIIKIYYQFLNN